MGRQNKFTKEDVISALEDTKGLISVTAKRLHCAPSTVRSYVKRYPEVQTALDDEREKLVDLAEGKLLEAMRSDDFRHSLKAATYILSSLGRERGWGKSKE